MNSVTLTTAQQKEVAAAIEIIHNTHMADDLLSTLVYDRDASQVLLAKAYRNLREIQSMAGAPDASEACRNIIRFVDGLFGG